MINEREEEAEIKDTFKAEFARLYLTYHMRVGCKYNTTYWEGWCVRIQVRYFQE